MLFGLGFLAWSPMAASSRCRRSPKASNFGSHQGPTVRKICGTFADSRTLLREAELKLVNRDEFLDAMVVLEEGMRHLPPFRKGASMDELRAEMQRHLEILAPVLDLEALVAPSDGIANREVQEERSSGDQVVSVARLAAPDVFVRISSPTP